MAKAQFHKNQRVYVKPVGTWALIEHVVPHWAKGIEEPIRVHYDVGLGREFAAEELMSEEPVAQDNGAAALADLLERLERKMCGRADACGPSWLGTHPATAQRAARLRQC